MDKRCKDEMELLENTQQYIRAASNEFVSVADSEQHRQIMISAKKIVDSVSTDGSNVVVFGSLFVAIDSMLDGYKKAAIDNIGEAVE